MNVDFKDLPELGRLVPGALGSLFSMFMTKDSYPRKISTFFGGVAASYYATPYGVKVTGFDTGLMGFLLGFFGMAIIQSCFEGWKKFDVSIILRDGARQVLRLPAIPKSEDGSK